MGGYPGTTPAKPGEVTTLWGTGFGPANPPVASGQVFTGAKQLANSVNAAIGGTVRYHSDLLVWRKAHEFVLAVYKVTADFPNQKVTAWRCKCDERRCPFRHWLLTPDFHSLEGYLGRLALAWLVAPAAAFLSWYNADFIGLVAVAGNPDDHKFQRRIPCVGE